MFFVLIAIGCSISEPKVGNGIGDQCQPPRKQGNDWGGYQNERSSTQRFSRPDVSLPTNGNESETLAGERDLSPNEVASALRGDTVGKAGNGKHGLLLGMRKKYRDGW